MEKNSYVRIPPSVMAGLDPATHRARVGGCKRHCAGAQRRAGWVAGSEAGHDDVVLTNDTITGGNKQ
jgi:hypothetical protein